MDERRAASDEANRDLWDKRVRAHLAHALYPSARVEAGTYDVSPLELDELGDVTGLRFVHLQCNAGADTLAWARRGAVATGVDFSAEAIAEARRLSAATGIDATFVCADVYDLPADLGPFDLVYTSMGVLWWLPDLDGWAASVRGPLRPDGRLYLHETHPLRPCMSTGDVPVTLVESNFGTGEPEVFETTGTYYDAPAGFAAEPAMEHGTLHDLGEIVTALASAGLRIESLREHASSTFRMPPSLVWGDDGRWTWPPGAPRLPLTFSLVATR